MCLLGTSERCINHTAIFYESFNLFNQLKKIIVKCHYCDVSAPYRDQYRYHQHTQSKRHRRNKAAYKPQLKLILNNHIDRDSLTVVMGYL